VRTGQKDRTLDIADCLPLAELEAQHVASVSKYEDLTFRPHSRSAKVAEKCVPPG
jgi:hypothetical protein